MSVRFRFAGRSGGPGPSLKSGYDEDCALCANPDIIPSLWSTASPCTYQLSADYNSSNTLCEQFLSELSKVDPHGV